MQSGAAGEASTSAGASAANDADNVAAAGSASAAAAANIEDPYASLNDDQCGGQQCSMT